MLTQDFGKGSSWPSVIQILQQISLVFQCHSPNAELRCIDLGSLATPKRAGPRPIRILFAAVASDDVDSVGSCEAGGRPESFLNRHVRNVVAEIAGPD